MKIDNPNKLPVVAVIVTPDGYYFDCPICGEEHRRDCSQVPAVTGCDSTPANLRLVVAVHPFRGRR